MPKPQIVLGYARDDEDAYTQLDVYPRDVLAAQRKYRDLSSTMSKIEVLWRVAYITLQRRGLISQEMTFPAFTEEYQVESWADDDKDGEVDEEEGNPTGPDL